MLKYIQEVLRALREPSKPKLKVKKSKGNRFEITRTKTSINTEILAPNVGNENVDIENTKDIVNIKNTYEMLMKKFVNPRLDLMVPGIRSLEQLKLLHIKRKKDMISSSTSNKEPQLMSTLPRNKLKETDSTVPEGTVAKVGWSGQPTDKFALRPQVETSLYPGDIHSAFYVFPEIEDPLCSKKPMLKSEGHKKLCKISNKKCTPLRAKDKPVQLIKQIPKYHVSKFYNFDRYKNAKGSQEQKVVLNNIHPSSAKDITNKENLNKHSLKSSDKSQRHDTEKMEITDETKLAHTDNLSSSTIPHQYFKEENSLEPSGKEEVIQTNRGYILDSGECVIRTELNSDTGIENKTEIINNMTSEKSQQVENIGNTHERLNDSQSKLISPEKTSPIETNVFQCEETEKLKLYTNTNECNVNPRIHLEQPNRVFSNDNLVSKDTIGKQNDNAVVKTKTKDVETETLKLYNNTNACNVNPRIHLEQPNRVCSNDKLVSKDMTGKRNDNAGEKTVEGKSKMPVVNSYNSGYKFYKNCNVKVFRDKNLQMPYIFTPKEEIKQKKGHEVTLTHNLNETNTSKLSKKLEQATVENKYDYLKLAKDKIGSFHYYSKDKGVFSGLTSNKIEEKGRAKVNIMNKKVRKQHKSTPKIERNVFNIRGFKPEKTNLSIGINLYKSKKEITKHKSHTLNCKKNETEHVWNNKFDSKLSLLTTLPKNSTHSHPETIQTEKGFHGKAINSTRYLQPNAATTENIINKVKAKRFANKLFSSHSCVDTTNKPKTIVKQGQKRWVFKKPLVKQYRSKIETHNIDKISKTNILKSQSNNVINNTLLSKENTKFLNEKKLTGLGITSISHERVVQKGKVYNKISVPELIEISTDKARKLHSKKLNPKPISLKMYGKDKMYDIESYSSDLQSLKSVPIVRNLDKRARKTKPLGSLNRSSVENMKQVHKNPSDLIMSTKIHTRNLFTAEYKANMMVNYLCRRFASTVAERNYTSNRFKVKNGTKNVLRVSTAPNILDQPKNEQQASRTTTCSDKIKQLETVLKYKHNKTNYTLPKSLMKGAINSVSAAMVKNGKLYHEQDVVDRTGDSEIDLKKPLIELTLGKPQKNDYKVEVLYSRQDSKNKPIHQRENTINLARGGRNNESGNINFNLIRNNKESQQQSMHTGSPKAILKQSNNSLSDSSPKTVSGNGRKNELSNEHLNTNNLMDTWDQSYGNLNNGKKKSKEITSKNNIKKLFFTNSEQSQQPYKLKVDNCHKVDPESKLRDSTVTLDCVDKVIKYVSAPIKVTSSQVDLHRKKSIDSVLKGTNKWKSKVERLQKNKVLLENSPEKHDITRNSRKITIIKCSSTNKNMNLKSSTTSEPSEIKKHSSHIGSLEVSAKDILPNTSCETYTESTKGNQCDRHLAGTKCRRLISKNSSSNVHGEKQSQFTELKRKEETQIKTDYLIKQKEICRIVSPRPPVDPTKQISKKLIDKPFNTSKISNNKINETDNNPDEKNISRDIANKATMAHSTNTSLPEVKPLTKLVPLDITGVDHTLNKTLINSSNKFKSNKTITEGSRSLKYITKTAELSERKRAFNRTNNRSSSKIVNESSITENATNEIPKSNCNIISKYLNESKGTVVDHNTSNIKEFAVNNCKTIKDVIEKVDTNTCLTSKPASINGIRLLKDSKINYTNDIKTNCKLSGSSKKLSISTYIDDTTLLKDSKRDDKINSNLSGTTDKLSASSQLKNAFRMDRAKSMIYKRTTMSNEATNKAKTSGLIEMGNKNGPSSKLINLSKNTAELSKLPVSVELAKKRGLSSKLTDVSETIEESLGSNEMCIKSKREFKMYTNSKHTDISDSLLEKSNTSDSITLSSQSKNKDIGSKSKPYERNIEYKTKRNTLHEGLLRSLKLTLHPVQSITNINFNKKPHINSVKKNLAGKKEKENLSKKLKTNKDIEHSIPPKNIKVHQFAIEELRKFEKKTKEGVKTVVNHVLNKGCKINPNNVNKTQATLDNQVKLDTRIHPIEKEKYDLVFLPSDEDLLSDMTTDKANIIPNTLTQRSSRHVERNNKTEKRENKEIQNLSQLEFS